MNSRKQNFVVVILTLIMTFMEMTALPAALFINIKVLDIEPIYFALMANFLLAFGICALCKKFLIQDWVFGLQRDGVLSGLRRYGLPAVIATVIVTLVFAVGLSPFDYQPTVWKVIVEGIVYYIGVGIMEELYLRGLLQNAIEKWLGKRKNASLSAVTIASILFGLGHIFGALGQPVITILCKTIWAAALGIYFGAIYVKTRNLWVPIFLHFFVDLCGLPFCFSTQSQYPPMALAACLICYCLLGTYGIYIIKKGE